MARTRRGRWALFGLVAALVALAAAYFAVQGTDERREAVAGPTAADDRGAGSSLAGDAPAAPSDLVRLAASEVEAGVRLGGGGRLDGRVVDVASGSGVAGARVTLALLPHAGAEFGSALGRLFGQSLELEAGLAPVAAAISDASGAFRLEGVRAGEYFAEARGSAHVSVGASPVRVDAAGSGGPLELLVRAGGAVEGSVRRADGRAAEGTVWIYHGASSFFTAARRGELTRLEQRLAPDGTFAFRGLAAGADYDLTVVGPRTPLTHRTGVDVRAGETTRIDLVARAGGVVTGRVLGVDDEDGTGGAPLAQAMVGPVPRGLRDLAFVEPMLREIGTLTDASGGYVLRDVPPGQFDVAALSFTHLPGRVAQLALTDGAELVAPDIVLVAGDVIEGRCVDTAGAPIAGVEVRWEIVDFEEVARDFSFTPLLWRAQRYFSWPRSDADGRFRAGPIGDDEPQFVKAGHVHDEERSEAAPVVDGVRTYVFTRGSAVEGIVMDVAAGEPITRFTVDAAPRAGGGDRGLVLAATGTLAVDDPNGRFRVEGLEPGEGEVLVRAPGFAPARVEVALEPEGVTRGVVVELARGAAVSGRVVDPEGVAVAGARVLAPATAARAQSRRGGFFGDVDEIVDVLPAEILAGATGVLGSTAMTDRSGGFELSGLAGETTDLQVFHPDFVPGQLTVEHAPGARVDGIEIALSRGGGLEGRVVDRFARPLPGAVVIASAPPRGRMGASPLRSNVYQGAADEEGRYRIAPMEGGSYFVVAMRGDEQFALASLLGSLTFDFVHVPKDEVMPYDVVDRSAGACRVHGLVLDRGVPVSGGVVVAADFASENVLGFEFKLAPVGPDGSYAFAGLAPADYQFTYQDTGENARDEVRVTAEVPDRADWRFDVRLPEGVLEGRVRSEVDGAPIERATVRLRRLVGDEGSGWLGAMISGEGRTRTERTDESGAFAFERLEAGEYELVAQGGVGRDRQQDWAPSEAQRLTLDADARVDGIELALAPALRWSGFVRDPSGAPIAGARVVAEREGGAAGRGVGTTDAEGRFELRGLAPGTYALAAAADGYADARRAGIEFAADTEPVTLTLGRGATLTVRVVAPDGRPATGATGRVEHPDGTAADARPERAFARLMEGEGVAGSDGRLIFEAIAPGTWTVVLWRGNARGRLENVTVTEGDDLELRIDLR